MEIKQIFLLNSKMADLKKTELFKIANSQDIFVKISWIVGLIDVEGIDVAQPFFLIGHFGIFLDQAWVEILMITLAKE